MSVAYETTPSHKQANIPTQNLESPFIKRRLSKVLTAIIPQQYPGSDADMGKPLELNPTFPEPLDDDNLELLRSKLDRREIVSPLNILIIMQEQLGLMPSEIDEVGHDERVAMIGKLSEIENFYRSNFFIEDSKPTSVPRIDMELIEDLYDATDLAKTPLLQSITNAQNHARLGVRYRSQLMEADRIARIMFLDNQQ
jgi:hypothetical protein